jgi:hypothetical protein
MQAYKVVGRLHRRVTPQGTLQSFAVGDVLEDIRFDELQAFPDRFTPATSAEVDAWHERQAQLPTVMRAKGLSPEQAQQHADLTRQIQELEAQQQALLAEAQTPVAITVPMAEGETPPPGRRSEGLPGSGIADAPGHISIPASGGAIPMAVTETAPTTPRASSTAAPASEQADEAPHSRSSQHRR